MDWEEKQEGQFRAYAQRVTESGAQESWQVPDVEIYWANDSEHWARHFSCPCVQVAVVPRFSQSSGKDMCRAFLHLFLSPSGPNPPSSARSDNWWCLQWVLSFTTCTRLWSSGKRRKHWLDSPLFGSFPNFLCRVQEVATLTQMSDVPSTPILSKVAVPLGFQATASELIKSDFMAH